MDLDDLIEQLPAQAASLDRPLLDPRQPRGATPALSLALDQEWRGALGEREWRFRAGVAGAAAVSILAGENDADADHVFGPAAKKAGAAAPLLAAAPGRAWLKLTATGEARGSLGRRNGATGIAFSGQGELRLGAYLRAEPAHSLREALASRRGAGVFALDPASVRRLGIDDACFLAIGGTLTARVEVDWADALAVPLPALAALSPDGDLPALAVDAKASVSVDFELSDSFRLVFVGRDADRVGVQLRRSTDEAFALRAEAGARARLANPDIPRELLADLAAQVLGIAPAQFAKLRADLAELLALADDASSLLRVQLAKAGARLDAAVDEAGLPLARRRLAQLRALCALALAADRESRAAALGLPLEHLAGLLQRLDSLGASLAAHVGARLDALLARWQAPALAKQPLAALHALLAWLDRVEAALVAAASRRIEAGIDFEYQRVSSDEALFAGVLGRSHAGFEALHAALLALDFASVLEATRHPGSGIALESFLHHKTLKRSLSLGLDLGGFYSERDSSTREWAESLRILPDPAVPQGQRRERRVALKGNRTRVEAAFGSRSLWRGDFAADFTSFDAGGNNGRWRFALALGFRSASPAASEAWLRGAADYAAVFGVVPETGAEALGERLLATGAPGKLASVELALTLRPEAFEHDGFLRAFAQVDEATMRGALATALQRIEGFPERCDIARRRAAYARSVEVLLGSSGVDLRDIDEVGAFVARELHSQDASLRAFEAQHDPPSPGSVADIARRTGSLLGLFREFRQAASLERFRTAASPGGGADRKQIEKALAGWDLAWRDRYPLRWQLALLRQLALDTGVPRTAVEARLKLVVEGRTAWLFNSPAGTPA
jgi:hypothetical protein